MKDLKAALQEVIENMLESELFTLLNNYYDACNYLDDKIYYMSDFDELCEGDTSTEIINSVAEGFNTNDDYIRYTIYGWESFSYIDDDIYCISDLINYIIRNEDALDNYELQEVLDEFEEEEEE